MVARAVVTREVVSEGEASRAMVAALQRAVGEREAEVARLEAEVARAAGELEQAAALLQGSKDGKEGGDPLQRSLVAVRAELYEARQQVGTPDTCHLSTCHLSTCHPAHQVGQLQEQVQEAEEAARDKAEELSDCVAR